MPRNRCRIRHPLPRSRSYPTLTLPRPCVTVIPRRGVDDLGSPRGWEEPRHRRAHAHGTPVGRGARVERSEADRARAAVCDREAQTETRARVQHVLRALDDDPDRTARRRQRKCELERARGGGPDLDRSGAAQPAVPVAAVREDTEARRTERLPELERLRGGDGPSAVEGRADAVAVEQDR